MWDFIHKCILNRRWRLLKKIKREWIWYRVPVWIQMIVASAFLSCRFLLFFLVQTALVDFSTVNSAFVHYSWTHKFHFWTTFSLKMGSTALFTHLKIILLQCFQFQFSVSTKISSIQTDPVHYQIEPRKEYKILSPPREWDMIAIYGLKFKVARLNIRSNRIFDVSKLCNGFWCVGSLLFNNNK